MARGQERTVKAGQLDPYVQESIMQGRQQSENRLVAAMQEAGAAQRQEREIQAQTTAQGMQMGAEAYQQAATRAQQDKRAAEAEAAQREQNEFNKAMEDSRQRFEANENKLMKDHDLALKKEDWERAEKIHQEEIALRRAQMEIDAKGAASQDNFLHSYMMGAQEKELAYQKAITTDMEAADIGERDTDIYNKTRDRVADKAKVDFRNLKIQEKVEAKYVSEIGEFGVHPVPYISGKEYKAPAKVLQESLAYAGSKISVENLTPDTIGNVRDALRKGEIDTEDIRSASAVLDGVLPALEDRVKESKGQDQILWKAFRMRVENMQSNLEGLRYSKEKIEGRPHETVGSAVRRGLGTKYPALSYNTRMMEMRNTMGGINDAFMKRMTESIEPWETNLLNIDPTTMSEFEIQEREAHNNSLRSARQKFQGSSSVVPDWGAD